MKITKEIIDRVKKQIEERDTGPFEVRYGRAAGYIIIGRNLYWWIRLDHAGEDAVEFESMVPGVHNENPRGFETDLRPGIVIDKVGITYGEDVIEEGFIVERSNIDTAGDDFSSIKVTVRKLKDE